MNCCPARVAFTHRVNKIGGAVALLLAVKRRASKAKAFRYRFSVKMAM